MTEIKVKKEGTRLSPGGPFDMTKIFSPEIIILPNDKKRLFYAGGSCQPQERNGYRILAADSNDGLNFTKLTRIIIDISATAEKVYSPCVIPNENGYRMYFAICRQGIYQIYTAFSSNCFDFQIEKKEIIGINKFHQKAIHTPKVKKKDNLFYCYYTGSNSLEKNPSTIYPQCDFSKDFRIFCSISHDGIHFKFQGEIKFKEKLNLINYYGHNVVINNGLILLFFSGFDGAINKLYLAESLDGVNFSKVKVLLKPNIIKGEVGYYSCTLDRLNNNRFRIYYGVRDKENMWRIESAQLDLTNYFV